MKKYLLSLIIFLIVGNIVFSQTTISDVPYFYQYDNDNNPDGTCQITAMAMVLQAYGATTVTPDIIYNRYYYGDAKDPIGWAEMFNSEAVRYGLTVRASGTNFGSASSMRNNLDQKKPVVVFGYFTGGGHIILTVGYDATHYVCNDPAGKWSQVYKYGGYSGVNSTEGKYVRYTRANYEYAIATPAPDFWMCTFSEPLSTDPYCTSRGSNTIGEWIKKVTVGGYNFETGNNNGYLKSTVPINVSRGESYNITLTPDFSTTTYTENWRVWIDFNGDNDFSDAGEQVIAKSGTTIQSAIVAIPATAKIGDTRMRVSMKGDAAPTACETFPYGEVEDYLISIGEGTVSHTISINHPATATVGQNITMNGTASSGITRVVVTVDGYTIKDMPVTNGSYSFSYAFSSTGTNRQIVAKGYNASGTQLASKTSTITVNQASSNFITVTNPATATTGQSINFSGTASTGISRVVVTVDGYTIKDMAVTNGAYSFYYTFNGTGTNRAIVAKGYNSAGTLLASANSTITVTTSTSYSVTINHVATAQVGQSVTFSGTASAGISKIKVSVDGWEIKDMPVTNGSYSFAYTFNGAGTNRAIVVNAFNSAGTILASKNSTITINATQTWGETFVTNVLANSVAYENQAWSDINYQGTPCVAFVCVGLRNHPTKNFPGTYCTVTEGPASESCSVQLSCTLKNLGFSGPYYDVANMQKGDIVFTERTVPAFGSYWSSHAMIFHSWETSGSTSYAYFIDYHNERGLPYLRNCAVSGTYDKAYFYYRYNNTKSATEIEEELEQEVTEEFNYNVFPNPATDIVYVEFGVQIDTEIKIELYDIQGTMLNSQFVESLDFNKVEINTSDLNAGIYFIRITGDTISKTEKIIINK